MSARFPEDFCFRLTVEEKAEVVAKCDRLRLMRFSNSLPWAFTGYGALQAANVLKTERAVRMGVAVVRAFLQLRQMVAAHHVFAAKLAELEERVGGHDEKLAEVVAALRELMMPAAPEHGRKIGFHFGNR